MHLNRIIPKVVGVIPDKFDLNDVIEILEEHQIRYDDITIFETDEIKFIDCGGNLESISCNICGTDLMDKWGDYMNQSFETNFTNRSIFLECCNHEVELEDLNYYFDVGFSKFVLELLNPSCTVNEDVLTQIERVLGTELKCIYVSV